MKRFLAASLFATMALAGAWAAHAKDAATKPSADTSSDKAAKPAKPSGPAVPIDLEPIHNGHRIGRKIISGSCPYGDRGFKMLAQQGVKTIISVDGAKPDLALALKYKMRYVHIPVTYSGVTRAQALSIARAVRDLQGPVFIHCHHGKHRGPTAAVLAVMITEGWTTDQAQAALGQAGTSTHYKGLWENARSWKKATEEELDKADASFPEVAKVPATAAAMVEIDERWEYLEEVRDAGWKAPPSNPDIDPPHQALLLREALREHGRSPDIAKFPTAYMEKLNASEQAAADLEAALRANDNEKAAVAFKAVGASCKSCHADYRDAARNAEPNAEPNAESSPQTERK